MKKTLLLAATIFCFSNLINAQAGQLDPSFGNGAVVKTDIGAKYPYTNFARQILSLPDGNMYVTEGLKGLTKRFSNGSLDSTFGVEGNVKNYIYKAALQPDGKIVGIGTGADLASSGLRRYDANGRSDNTFSGDGKQAVPFNAEAVAVQKDGKILVAGFTNSYHYFRLARYNSNGIPDSTFDGDGLVTSNIQYNADIGFTTAIAIQTDGKIVVAGAFPLVRYQPDGTIDKTFSGNGINAFQGFSSIAIQKDGKIVTIGLDIITDQQGDENITDTICRFNTDGSFDKSFSGDGKLPLAYQTPSLALQTDKKIVTVASVLAKDENGNYVKQFDVTRYNADGSLDKSFSNDGMQTTSFGNGPSAPETVAVQSDGKIVAGGSTHFSEELAIARYNANGSLDTTFDGDGKLIDSNQVGRTVYKSTAIQKDGKLVVAGSTYSGFSSDNNLVIARYNTNGSLDSTFNKNGILITGITLVGDYAINIAAQSDGKIIAASEEVAGLVRYNADGSTDTTFHYNTDNKQTVRSLALQQDGKIVAEGPTDYGTYEIRRYNINGSQDNAFGQNGIATVIYGDKTQDVLQGSATSMAIQKDGKIVVGGVNNVGFSNVSVALFRLNTNGSLDNTFSNDGKVSFPHAGVASSLLAIQNDGKIIIGSDYANNNSSANGVLLKRFNNDGSVDNSFNGKNPLHYAIYSTNRTSIAIQNNGEIVLGGSDLVRLNTNGGLDSNFHISDQQKADFYINDIAITGSKVYAAGGGIYGTVARYLLDSSNTPPTVRITAPANNAVYPAPATITIDADAKDTDGTIRSVKFYNGTTYLKTDFTSPYSYTLSNLPAGTYSLTAKATDNNGAETISAAVIVKINKAPVVSITSPADNATFTAPANITVNALAADADGSVYSVKFYKDSVYLKTDFTSPYSYTVSSLPEGTYSLTVKATDNNGAQTISAPVTVKVLNASMVSSKPYLENEKIALNDALSLKLSPNPTTNIVNIYRSGLQQNKNATLSLISSAGIVLKTMQLSNAATQLDVSSLVSGVYTIKMISGEKVFYKQFVKL